MPRKTSILICCFNKLELTRACLERLRAVTPAELYELIVVDNASEDGTGGYLEAEAGRRGGEGMRLVRSATNLGFVGGNNLAAEHATGEFLVFLNNDTLPGPGWLEALLELAERDPRAGAVGAKLVYPDGRLQEAGGGIFSDGHGYNHGNTGDPDFAEYEFVREVDYCSGACLLVRAELFRRLGGFDTRYAPAYFEDSDLCFGVRSLGFRVMYQPRARVVHLEGGTAGTDTGSGMKRFQEINRPKFAAKWARELESQPPPTGDRRRLVRGAQRARGAQVLMAHDAPPFHDRSAGALRLYNLIRMLLAEGHHVTYVCVHGEEFEGIPVGPYLEDLRQAGVLVHAMDRPARRLPGERALTGHAALRRLLTERDYDVAHLPWHYAASQFIPTIRLASPRTRIVIDCQDVHFRREARRLLGGGDPGEWATYAVDKAREISNYRMGDRMLTVTEEDAEALRVAVPDREVRCVPDFYPLPEGPLPGFAERQDVVFVAGFKHPPNVDAALHFHREVWPEVARRLPEARWVLLGDSPPPGIVALQGERVIVTGYVPDLAPYLQAARVAVAPIRFGAGMKGKIVNALSHGLPCVATPVGAEGMGLEHGREILVAGTPQEFAAAVEAVYRQADLWQRLSDGGRALVERRYGHAAIYPLLAGALGLSAPRAARDLADPLALADEMGEAYSAYRAGTPRLAAEMFERCAAARPDLADPRIGLALCCARTGELQRAESLLREALAVTKSPAHVLSAYGTVLVAAGRPVEAAAQIQEAIRHDPRSLWAVGEAAQLAEKCGNVKVAAQGYARLAELDGEATWPLIKLAEMLAALGEEAALVEVFDVAFERARKAGRADVLRDLRKARSMLKAREPAAAA